MFGLRRRVRIVYEPILWNARGDPQIEEKKDAEQVKLQSIQRR